MLAAGLLERAELREFAVHGEAGFLREFPARRGERILVRLDGAFGNGPGAGVLVLPERAAGMDEEELEILGLAPVHQNASAAPHMAFGKCVASRSAQASIAAV